jgi:cytoskeletal protein CcmA (bactofilin family)
MVVRNHWQAGAFVPASAGKSVAKRDLPREMDCPYCGQRVRAGARAMGARCMACQRNLVLDDVVVRGESVRSQIITCGTILVEPAARFFGVLQGSEVVIAGRVMGTVIGTQRVEVTATGKVAGSIATRQLHAHDSALIDGEVAILHADRTVSKAVHHS